MPHFIIIQQISVLNILNMLYNLQFFSSKCRLFHNAALFGFCITHILNTGVLKFEKKKIRRQKVNPYRSSALRMIVMQVFHGFVNFFPVNYYSTIALCSSVIHGWSNWSICRCSAKESSLTSFILLKKTGDID